MENEWLHMKQQLSVYHNEGNNYSICVVQINESDVAWKAIGKSNISTRSVLRNNHLETRGTCYCSEFARWDEKWDNRWNPWRVWIWEIWIWINLIRNVEFILRSWMILTSDCRLRHLCDLCLFFSLISSENNWDSQEIPSAMFPIVNSNIFFTLGTNVCWNNLYFFLWLHKYFVIIH